MLSQQELTRKELEQFGGRLTHALGPGERLLSVSETRCGFGIAPDNTPPQPDRRSAGSRAVDAVLAPSAPEWSWLGVFGRAANGVWNSLGVAMHHAYKACHSLRCEPFLAVTDQRLLMFAYDGEFQERVKPMELVWQCPRHSVRTARVRAARLSWARLRIEFIDNSWNEFVSALYMGRRRAKAIRDALASHPPYSS